MMVVCCGHLVYVFFHILVCCNKINLTSIMFDTFKILFCFFLIFLWPMPLFLLSRFNTQTMHIKSFLFTKALLCFP
jgi:hypothetical protein